MSDSIVNITAAAKVLSPVPGIEYVHHRKECKRKQEILYSKSSTLSPGEELIVQYVKDSQHKNNQQNNRTPPTKRQCRIHACISPTENSDAIELPNPESGEAYTKGEIVNILSNVPIGDGSVRSCIRSGVEQPADLARVFKLIKNLLPSHTVKNIPAERCPMKALMLDAFKEQLVYLN